MSLNCEQIERNKTDRKAYQNVSKRILRRQMHKEEEKQGEITTECYVMKKRKIYKHREKDKRVGMKKEKEKK